MSTNLGEAQRRRGRNGGIGRLNSGSKERRGRNGSSGRLNSGSQLLLRAQAEADKAANKIKEKKRVGSGEEL